MNERTQLKLDVFMKIAITVAELSTCKRRKVGCVLLSEDWRVLSTGYNGTPSKSPHCGDECTDPEGKYISGSICNAVHAETNALAYCHNQQLTHTAIVTSAPCSSCIKSLAATSCKNIYYLNTNKDTDFSSKYWDDMGIGKFEQLIITTTNSYVY
jgi:dCMP deaminase